MVFLEGLCGIESANMGPSEILCWADASTSPDIVASSMLAQNEHDKSSLDHFLCFISNHNVPDASDISEKNSPVRTNRK